MQQGRILKGIGGFYYVLPEDSSETVECKARGRFRMDGLTPMVGDRVLFETQREGHARIAELLPRKNALMRPPVANIDQLLIVLSASVPAPDWLLADKLIVQAKLLSYADHHVIDDAGDEYCALGWAFARGSGKPAEAYDRPSAVFSCCAAAAIYRMSTFEEIGYFDERHYCYLEDVDIGWRARIYGYQNWYEPAAVVYHVGSAASGSRHNPF